MGTRKCLTLLSPLLEKEPEFKLRQDGSLRRWGGVGVENEPAIFLVCWLSK